MEVLRRYSNLADLLKRMQVVLRRIEEDDETDEPGVCSTGRGGGPRSIQERFSEAQLGELAADFRRGTMIRVLACQFSMSESSVKRVLREYGASRRDHAV